MYQLLPKGDVCLVSYSPDNINHKKYLSGENEIHAIQYSYA